MHKNKCRWQVTAKHANTLNPSGLTMLSRVWEPSRGKKSSKQLITACLFGHLNLMSHCGLILAWFELVCVSWSPFKRKSAGGEWFVKPLPKILIWGKSHHQPKRHLQIFLNTTQFHLNMYNKFCGNPAFSHCFHYLYGLYSLTFSSQMWRNKQLVCSFKDPTIFLLQILQIKYSSECLNTRINLVHNALTLMRSDVMRSEVL